MLRNTHTPRNILTALSFAALLATPMMATAAPKEEAYSGWNWSAHVGTLNIDSKVAQVQGIEDSAWVLGAAAERFSSDSILTFLVGIDLVGYSDNYSFSQDTDHGQKSSSASAAMVYVEFGPKIKFGAEENNYLITHIGLSNLFGSERSIDFCSDCYSENIDVKGGAYGVLGVGHSFGRVDIGLQYQQYFGGDLDNSLRFDVSTSF